MNDPDVQKVILAGFTKGMQARMGTPGLRQLWFITLKCSSGVPCEALHAAACAPQQLMRHAQFPWAGIHACTSHACPAVGT